jgi:nucleotide-binding universal stress UspA family protein
VAIDDGTMADGAIAAALRLSGRFGARCEFLHARERRSLAWTQRAHGDDGSAAALDDFRQRAAARIHGASAGVATQTRDELVSVKVGRPAEVILERAVEWPADVIVLGRHERRGLLDFGGTTRAVLASSPCPVWVQPLSPQPVRRILVPLDGSLSGLRVLAWARLLAKGFGARAIAFHCFQPPDFAYDPAMKSPAVPTYVVDDLRASERAAFETFARGYDWNGIDAEVVFEDGRPGEAILARQRDVDLIVMGTHSRSRVARALLGSTANEVLPRATTAVLAVPLAKEHYAAA